MHICKIVHRYRKSEIQTTTDKEGMKRKRSSTNLVKIRQQSTVDSATAGEAENATMLDQSHPVAAPGVLRFRQLSLIRLLKQLVFIR